MISLKSAEEWFDIVIRHCLEETLNKDGDCVTIGDVWLHFTLHLVKEGFVTINYNKPRFTDRSEKTKGIDNGF